MAIKKTSFIGIYVLNTILFSHFTIKGVAKRCCNKIIAGRIKLSQSEKPSKSRYNANSKDLGYLEYCAI